MRFRLSTIQTQKQILSPFIQQSIEVLLLPIVDLHQLIDQEIQSNPLLEINEDSLTPEQSLKDLFSSYQNFPLANSRHSKEDEKLEEKPITRSVPLEDQLCQQLKFEFSEVLEIRIGEFIIGNLNEDGYLHCTGEEIQEALSLDNTEIIEKILKRIRHFEPIGIASRSLKECLITQIQLKAPQEISLFEEIINNHLEDIASKKFEAVARKLKISVEKVKNLVQVIVSLEPKPARNHRPIASNIYMKPDVFIIKNEDDLYQVVINQESLPPLKISSLYQKMLQDPKLSAEDRNFITEKMKNAVQFIKCIDQRHQTLKQIAEYILNYQKDFWDHGYSALRPMILRDVAQAVNRNESTISRAINNKYIATPQGLLPIKVFFSQSLSNNSDGGSISNRSVQEEIKSMIDTEEKTKPLSDQDIQTWFERKGMRVARRTITKYRKNLSILPSYLRKK